MSGKTEKKLRRYIREYWRQYLLETAQWSIGERLDFAWKVITKGRV
jgi:hypothetical protein